MNANISSNVRPDERLQLREDVVMPLLPRGPLQPFAIRFFKDNTIGDRAECRPRFWT